MKIGICSLGPNLDSPISPVFGRALYFLIVNPATEEFKVIANSALKASQGAGVEASQIVISQRVKAVICGNFGPNAFSILKMAGVKIYSDLFGLTVKEVISKYKKGELKEARVPTAPSHFGSVPYQRFGQPGGKLGRRRLRRRRRGGRR